MHRQQISLVVLLAILATWLPVSASEPTAADSGSGSTLTGKLTHNSADQNGIAPYAIVDQWGVVRGYVAARPGLELEPYLNRQVTLQGTVRTLSGGDMPQLTAEKVLAGQRAAKPAVRRPVAQGPRPSPIQQVAHQEMIPAPSAQPPLAPVPTDSSRPREPSVGPPQYSDLPGQPSLEPGGGPPRGDGSPCQGCGPLGPCCGPCGPCGPPCRVFSDVYAKTDYLLWWMRGMNVPPLVTTGPNADHPGVLGQGPGLATILFGDTQIDDRVRSGGRLQLGGWLDDCHTLAIEADFLALEPARTHFRDWSDGNPIVSRPFINDATGQQDVEFVAFPAGNRASLAGAVNVDAFTRFESTGALLRFATCRQNACWTDSCCNAFHDSIRTDFLLGYRFLRLDDRLQIVEQLTSTDTTVGSPSPAGTSGLIRDQFNTTNEFNGGEIGFDSEIRRNRWSLDLLTKIALGDNHEICDIAGFTRNTSLTGVQTSQPVGLLATATNSGHHVTDRFAVVPEVTATLGFQLTGHTALTFGYTLVYWSQVARAGDQIDFRVPTPGSATTTGHPEFPSANTGFWAQGLNFGFDFRW